MDYNWSGWTDWTVMAETAVRKFAAEPSNPGAYAIASNQPLTRCVGTDPYGFLTIGESDDLQRRIQAFWYCAINRDKEGHMAGWRYAFFRFARFFPYASLRLRWRIANTKEEANECEGRMLLVYLANHCELPPLNYQFNWRPFEKDGWDLFDTMLAVDVETVA